MESARANLLALGLDSRNESAAKNLVVNLNVWAIELTVNRKFEKAMAVVSVGREMVPNETTLREITLVLCDAWAKDFIAREDWTGAVQVYSRRLREFPKDEHLTNNEMYCRMRLR